MSNPPKARRRSTFLLGLGCSAVLALTGCSGAASPAPITTSTLGASPTAGPSLAAPSVVAPSAALQPVRFSYDWVPDSDWAATVWADELGYFAEEGVAVDYVPGDPTLLEQFATRQFDMAQVPGPFIVQAFSEGLPFTVVGVTLADSPLVVVADAAKVRSVEDIEGTTVAVQVGEFEESVWGAWAAANGIDRTTLEEVPAAGLGDVLFIDGQVDVMMDFYTSGSMVALTEGHEGEETLFLVSETQELVGQSVAVHNDFLRDQPEAVRGFLAAWARGAKYMIDHPDESIELVLERFPELERPGVEWSTAGFIEFWSAEQPTSGGLLSFTPEMWESTKQLLVDTDRMEDLDISGLYTMDYLPDPPVFP